MRAPVTEELFEEKMMWAATRGDAAHRQLASQLLAWAEHSHEDDELSTIDLMVCAGEQFALASDHERALEIYRSAVERDEVSTPDARGYMIRALLDLGRNDEAEQVSAQLRRARPSSPDTYAMVGEAWEDAGDLDRANQWFTRGVMLADEHGTRIERVMLLIARLRVRRALGFPPDDYDQEALPLMERAAGRLQAD